MTCTEAGLKMNFKHLELITSTCFNHAFGTMLETSRPLITLLEMKIFYKCAQNSRPSGHVLLSKELQALLKLLLT